MSSITRVAAKQLEKRTRNEGRGREVECIGTMGIICGGSKMLMKDLRGKKIEKKEKKGKKQQRTGEDERKRIIKLNVL